MKRKAYAGNKTYDRKNMMARNAQIITDRINCLREKMSENHIDVYYIPTDDFHGSEFVSDFFKAREYMSGFTGSAGTLIITKDMAGLFTDGRYFLQAEEELRGTGIELFKAGNKDVPDINEFLESRLSDNMILGFDGRCVTAAKAVSIREYFESKGKNIILKGDTDIVASIWKDKPGLPQGKAYVLEEKYSGETYESKLTRVRTFMTKKKSGAFVLTALDDIAWLLNIRGDDIKCSPLVLSYIIITKTEVIFYCGTGTRGENKLSGIYDYLMRNGIKLKGYFDIYEDIKELDKEMPVIADLDKVNFRLYSELSDFDIMDIVNPTTEFKAIKNSTEIENQKMAHIKDAIAYVRFLYWFKTECLADLSKNDCGTNDCGTNDCGTNICETDVGATGDSRITELDIAEKLLSERKKMEGFVGESFEPIVAYGSHGAIVHYSPSVESNAVIRKKSFVLIDTGGHYFEGTTDITRTLVCGELTREEKEHYTLVLKGNLALGAARFIEGVSGAGLDMLARKPIWDRYLDYNHGTGHGVGYMLNVHEGPNGIRYRVGSGKNISVAMKPGMITSNEPGLYIEGKYGIRLENMIVCREDTENEFGKFLCFDTLTLVPFDIDAIEVNLLDETERRLLNDYHGRVYRTLAPYLNDVEKEFLKKITCSI